MANDLFVLCECGARIPVSPGMAGTEISCRCGRQVPVPRLGELRRISGRDEYVTNSVEAVRVALRNGELHGTECIHCHATTDRLIRCEVVCEKIAKDEHTVVGFIIEVLVALVTPFYFHTEEAISEVHGRDTVVVTSFRLCRGCQEAFGNPRRAQVLKQLLMMVPAYAKVFQEFPRADVSFLDSAE